MSKICRPSIDTAASQSHMNFGLHLHLMLPVGLVEHLLQSMERPQKGRWCLFQHGMDTYWFHSGVAEVPQSQHDTDCTVARIAKGSFWDKLWQSYLIRTTRLIGDILLDTTVLGEMNPPFEMLGLFTVTTGEMKYVYKPFQNHSLCWWIQFCFSCKNMIN